MVISLNTKKYLYVGIPILFFIGALNHFLYEISGESFIVSLVSPTNESIWEHIKLAFIPMILYWFFYVKIDKNINKDNWFFALLICLLIYIISIPMIYYFYTGAFGVEYLIVDILILLISITISHLIGYHIFVHKKNRVNYIHSITFIILLVIMFAIFTIYPPDLPIFIPN